MLHVRVTGVVTNGTNTATIVSLGTGAAGAETELCAVAVGGAGLATATAVNFQLPVLINAGTRIVARLQSIVTGGKTAGINLLTMDADPYLASTVRPTIDTLGLSTATSRGTAVAASNTYSQIVASTTVPYRGLVVVPSFASGNTQAVIGTMSVAIGAAGSEVDLGATVIESTAGEAIGTNLPAMHIPAFIPVGSRIAVKQSTAASYFDATVLGVPF
jgi:hypothetical protein